MNELHPLLATLVEEFLNERNKVRDATSVPLSAPLDVTHIQLSQNTKHLLLQINAHLTYDHFVSSVLEHELRTPLAGIVSTVQLLQAQLEAHEAELPDTLQKWCDRLEKLSTRMEFLLENMKQLHNNNYSSASTGKQTRILTNWLIKERKSLGELIKSSQILDLKLEMLDESFEYTTDYHLLSIILGTLVENASKYSPDNARMDILLEQSQEILRLKVIDNGVGLGANSSVNLIKAFQRGQEVGHIEGSGLGLSIAHAAAQRIQAQLVLYDNENAPGITAELILSNNDICQKTLF